jgi:hypothetical protein
VATFEVKAAPQFAALQFETYFFCTSEGEEPAATELEAARVKVFPRVSVGVEGGLCPYHPSPRARMFPEVTEEENASPQFAALQFEVKRCWTREGVALGTMTEFDVPSA